MNKKKYYVVWEGKNKGILHSWDACKKSIEGVKGAQYKSFTSYEEAKLALNNKAKYLFGAKAKSYTSKANIIKESLSVDAACSGNPGVMEYRGVYVKTGKEIFRMGPFEDGTNNIGEFLALVHGLAFLKKNEINTPIYSDSATAISWIKKKKCNTKLEQTPNNRDIFDLVERAEAWLKTNTYSTIILKWDTKSWGEIPADFGRK